MTYNHRNTLCLCIWRMLYPLGKTQQCSMSYRSFPCSSLCRLENMQNKKEGNTQPLLLTSLLYPSPDTCNFPNDATLFCAKNNQRCVLSNIQEGCRKERSKREQKKTTKDKKGDDFLGLCDNKRHVSKNINEKNVRGNLRWKSMCVIIIRNITAPV